MPLKILYALFIIINSPLLIAQTCQTTTITASTPNNRFTINTNGTVLDTKTGLLWKQCSEGLSGINCATGNATTYTWQGALQQAQTVNNVGFTGYKDWRVPNIKELRSITERQCYDPSINLTVFPNTISNYYWSSSPVAYNSYYAWIVDFYSGSDYWDLKDGNNFVRLVRGGQ
ncbi:MAG: DUF1566 domain-containing protein [Methylococcaceae bacterium]